MGANKGTKAALDRGVKLKEVLKEQKNASHSSKWKPPVLALSTPVGVGDLTLGSLMKQEKLEYPDAVAVYLAFQDTQKSSSRSKKKPSTTETDDTKTACSSAPTETAKKKSPKQAPNETKDTETACNSVPSRTANKKSSKQALEKNTETESSPKRSRNQVTPKSRPSKAALKRGVASSNLGLDEAAEAAVERPAKRIKGKTSPEPTPNPEDCKTSPEPTPNPQDCTTAAEEEDAALFMDWYELEEEYYLWRQGLPQLSEQRKALKAGGSSTPQSEPHAAPASMPALPAPAADRADCDDSQVCFDCIMSMH